MGKEYEGTRHNIGFECLDAFRGQDRARCRNGPIRNSEMPLVSGQCGADQCLRHQADDIYEQQR